MGFASREPLLTIVDLRIVWAKPKQNCTDPASFYLEVWTLRLTNPFFAWTVPIFIVAAPALAARKPEHPAPGTSLVRFAELDPNVYKGSTPKNEADFQFLQAKHVKYILSLKFLPWLDHAEQRKAKEHGITYLSVYMNASPVAPSTKHVNRILALLHDPCYQPIYFHCDIGRDRTSLIATLYQVYFDGLPPEKARQAMKDFGFKDSWTLRGLREYLIKHPEPPSTWSAPGHACVAAR